MADLLEIENCGKHSKAIKISTGSSFEQKASVKAFTVFGARRLHKSTSSSLRTRFKQIRYAECLPRQFESPTILFFFTGGIVKKPSNCIVVFDRVV